MLPLLLLSVRSSTFTSHTKKWIALKFAVSQCLFLHFIFILNTSHFHLPTKGYYLCKAGRQFTATTSFHIVISQLKHTHSKLITPREPSCSLTHNRTTWKNTILLCLSSLLQIYLVWFSCILLKQQDTIMLWIFTAIYISKETNLCTTTGQKLMPSSLQDQVHVVTVTEGMGSKRLIHQWK